MQPGTFLSVATCPNLEVKRAVHPDKSLVSVSVLLRAKTLNEYESRHYSLKVSDNAEAWLINLEGLVF